MNDKSPITVGALIRRLEEFDKDTPVVYRAYSDWAPLYASDVELVKGVAKSAWVMRVYENQIATMSSENIRNIVTFVGFPGN